MITFLNNLAFKDFWLKLFSFALAVLMWFTISSAITQQQDGVFSPGGILGGGLKQSRTLTVPVCLLPSSGQVRSCSLQPETVTVTVEGDPRVLANLQSTDIRAVVDLTGIVASRLSRQVQVSRPPGVTFAKADPDQVQITFATGN